MCFRHSTRDGSRFESLPFYIQSEDESKRFDLESTREEGINIPIIRHFPSDRISGIYIDKGHLESR
jgi:hypothetical protein